jgi:hypothetical protein
MGRRLLAAWHGIDADHPDAAAYKTIIGRGHCPAMVGLVGKGPEQGPCGMWPLVLPLAPYLDVVEKEAAS